MLPRCARPARSVTLAQRTSSNGDAHGPLTELARRTEGFSGSDLNELCSQAATMPVHESLRRRRAL